MKKYIIVFLATSMTLGLGSMSSCGGLERYRYPCQDPANWEKDECKPPLCEASGTCPVHIFGSVPNE